MYETYCKFKETIFEEYELQYMDCGSNFLCFKIRDLIKALKKIEKHFQFSDVKPRFMCSQKSKRKLLVIKKRNT